MVYICLLPISKLSIKAYQLLIKTIAIIINKVFQELKLRVIVVSCEVKNNNKMANTSCRYYTDRTLGWMMNNKIIVVLSALSFCLLISTWSMAAQRNRAYTTIDELNAQLATTPTPDPTPEGNITETIIQEETTVPGETTTPDETTTDANNNTEEEIPGENNGIEAALQSETMQNAESNVPISKLLSLLTS